MAAGVADAPVCPIVGASASRLVLQPIITSTAAQEATVLWLDMRPTLRRKHRSRRRLPGGDVRHHSTQRYPPRIRRLSGNLRYAVGVCARRGRVVRTPTRSGISPDRL